ncbi:hypothetical protein QEL84_003370 [Pseudomonas putida]|nr:hypothetical protein [Pseudomonas putida]
MKLNTGIFEVLSSDEASYIHGNADEIQTTHKKDVWLKDLFSGKVRKVGLKNSIVPTRPGAKIGLSFFNGEIIAFKRSKEIPVEDAAPYRATHNPILAVVFAVIAGVFFGFPFLGYLFATGIGLYSLISGNNLLGRYKKFSGNRLFALFIVAMSLYAWVIVRSHHVNIDAVFAAYWRVVFIFIIACVGFQLYKISVEKKYLKRAEIELNAAWTQVSSI